MGKLQDLIGDAETLREALEALEGKNMVLDSPKEGKKQKIRIKEAREEFMIVGWMKSTYIETFLGGCGWVDEEIEALIPYSKKSNVFYYLS